MNIVITGSSGFIGSYILNYFENQSHTIIAIDEKTSISVLDKNALSIIKNVDIVIHLAAKTFIPDSFINPLSFYELNVGGTLNILELCRRTSARLIFFSSYVYGNPKYLPIDEKHPVFGTNPYAHTKIIGENLCRAYYEDFGIPVLVFRPFNAYGFGQSDSFLIPKIINQAFSGRVTLMDPSPKRDIIHIDDIINAVVKSVDLEWTDYNIINLGSGKSYSVDQIANEIIKHFDNPISIEYSGETRRNEIIDTQSDIRYAKKLLNWEPKIGFEEGIQQTVSAYIKNNTHI